MCYSERTHYPTLEKLGAQNIAACENHGKQHELSDHWKSIKTLFSKKKWQELTQKREKDWLEYKF